MQDVKVFIRKSQDNSSWKLVVSELKKRKIKVHTKYKDCDVAIVLSGLYTNPSVFKFSYLFFNRLEWNGLWDDIYGPILEKYYSVVYDGSRMNLDQVVGLIEDTYNNEINKP